MEKLDLYIVVDRKKKNKKKAYFDWINNETQNHIWVITWTAIGNGSKF